MVLCGRGSLVAPSTARPRSRPPGAWAAAIGAERRRKSTRRERMAGRRIVGGDTGNDGGNQAGLRIWCETRPGCSKPAPLRGERQRGRYGDLIGSHFGTRLGRSLAPHGAEQESSLFSSTSPVSTLGPVPTGNP